MPLTSEQLQTLRTYLDANLPGVFDEEAAAAMNLIASPSYYVWQSTITRSEVYHQTSPSGTTWNWTTYKNQNVTEQNAWTQMFMGDTRTTRLSTIVSGIRNTVLSERPLSPSPDFSWR
jgi:hypothetical protein